MTRSKSIEKQIHLFYRRITALWLITAMLFGSILCFMITIFSVIFWQNGAGIGIFGAGSLVFGLLLITSAILTELYEIVLARKTIRQEMEDIFTPK